MMSSSALKCCLLWGVLCFLATAFPAVGADTPLPNVDPMVESTHNAWVIGHIYDAATGQALEKAQVTSWQPCSFPEKGEGVCVATDAYGGYKVARLGGRTSTKMKIAGFLFGGATSEKTCRLDIDSCVVRVAAPGYQAFEGLVPARWSDPSAMTMHLEPILLTPEGAAQKPFVATDWGALRVSEIKIEPLIQRPGVVCTATVKLTGPKVPPKTRLRGGVYCPAWTSPGLVEMVAKLEPDCSTWTFTRQFQVSKKSRPGYGECVVYVLDPPVDYLYGAPYERPVVQVVTNDAEQALAGMRAEAFDLRRQGKSVEAFAKYQELANQPGCTFRDIGVLMDLGRLLNSQATAVPAVEKWSQAGPDPEKLERAGFYALGLVDAGQYDKALELCNATIATIPEKQRAARVPAEMKLAMAQSYLQQGKLAEAGKLHKELAGKEDLPQLTDFSRKLQMALAREATVKAPQEAASWSNYAGLLLDEGRWDEAAGVLQEAQKLHPNSFVLDWTLRYAQLQAAGAKPPQEADLDAALKAAEAAVKPSGDKAVRVRDFFSWHAYGLLLYRKAVQQRQQGDPAGAQASLAKALEVLQAALRCARAGADVADIWGFGSGTTRNVAINGWAYPEAQADYTLITMVRAMAGGATGYVPHLLLAEALMKLRLFDLAAAELQAVQAERPACPQLTYLAARLALAQDDLEGGEKLLQDVLLANPNHDQANRDLARLYTDQGDLAQAATYLQAHTKFYGRAK